MSLDRVLMVVAAATLMSGCHLFRGADCHTRQEYQRAGQVPPLKVPPGVDTPNTQGALVIPTVELAPPPPGPKDSCPDVPPPYNPPPPPKPATPQPSPP